MKTYRTCVYIDGFNLYYAAIVDRPTLNIRYPSLRTLCLNKLNSFPDQEHTLEKIRYFTAQVKPTDEDPTKLMRQKNYNRALKREGVNMHHGKFVWDEKLKLLKEKRSDVNLASHFLNDAWLDEYDYAVIISNDTDFCGVIKMVRQQFSEIPEKIVDIWTVSKIADRLKKAATLHHRITDSELKALPQIANKNYTVELI